MSRSTCIGMLLECREDGRLGSQRSVGCAHSAESMAHSDKIVNCVRKEPQETDGKVLPTDDRLRTTDVRQGELKLRR